MGGAGPQHGAGAGIDGGAGGGHVVDQHKPAAERQDGHSGGNATSRARRSAARPPRNSVS